MSDKVEKESRHCQNWLGCYYYSHKHPVNGSGGYLDWCDKRNRPTTVLSRCGDHISREEYQEKIQAIKVDRLEILKGDNDAS